MRNATNYDKALRPHLIEVTRFYEEGNFKHNKSTVALKLMLLILMVIISKFAILNKN